MGPFKTVLAKLIESERPSSFNRDFMSTVLGVSGGAANPIVPILKKTGFLTDSGVPTPLYADFQTVTGRSDAALSALRRGFPEIFKRNQYAHKADKEKLNDIIRSITGLPSGDRIVGYIYNTFSTLQHYARNASDIASMSSESPPELDRVESKQEKHRLRKACFWIIVPDKYYTARIDERRCLQCDIQKP